MVVIKATCKARSDDDLHLPVFHGCSYASAAEEKLDESSGPLRIPGSMSSTQRKVSHTYIYIYINMVHICNI